MAACLAPLNLFRTRPSAPLSAAGCFCSHSGFRNCRTAKPSGSPGYSRVCSGLRWFRVHCPRPGSKRLFGSLPSSVLGSGGGQRLALLDSPFGRSVPRRDVRSLLRDFHSGHAPKSTVAVLWNGGGNTTLTQPDRCRTANGWVARFLSNRDTHSCSARYPRVSPDSGLSRSGSASIPDFLSTGAKRNVTR